MNTASDKQPSGFWDIVVGTTASAWLVTLTAVLLFPVPDWPGFSITDEARRRPFPSQEPPRHLPLIASSGEWLSAVLFDSFGIGVYVLLLGWCALILLMASERHWGAWCVRLIGWLCLAAATIITADFLGRELLGGPLIGSGGALGAWLHWSIACAMGPVGLWLVVGVLIGLGGYLAIEGVIVSVSGRSYRFMKRVLVGTVRVLRKIGQVVRRVPVPGDKLPPSASVNIPIHHHSEAMVNAPITMPVPATPREPVPIRGGRTLLPPPNPPAASQGPSKPFELPSLALLTDPEPPSTENLEQQLRETAALIEGTYKDFNVNLKIVGINTGPVITQYEAALETGLRVAKVTTLSEDLALNLRVPSVRIVAPLPGKNTVGIEVPNEKRSIVRMKEIMLATAVKSEKAKLPLFLGKDSEGRPLMYDLADMPHLLIAGRTGTGKSVCLNTIILSLLLTRTPEQCRMIMIDPKGGVELSEYDRIPHLMHPVIEKPERAEAVLNWAVAKMEERYELLRRARVRNLAAFNELTTEELARRMHLDAIQMQGIPQRLPYIVIFIDEVGELMMQLKKDIEIPIIRLAQKSRAAGIHVILATQKPTVDVITGLIKSNMPARICFQVASRSDSAVVLDEKGAEKLLGKGDMLFLQPATSSLVRAQGAYCSDAEISAVVQVLEQTEPQYDPELLGLKEKQRGEEGEPSEDETAPVGRKSDKLYEQAVEVVIREGRGSTSLLQRALGIGYGRAGRLIGYMEQDGIVSRQKGSAARDVLITMDEWEARKNGLDSDAVSDESLSETV